MAKRKRDRTLSPLLGTLADMHAYRRPMGSQTERLFIDRYIRPLPNAESDQFGNWHVSVGDSKILWSCHTDTVHRLEGWQAVSISRTGIMRVLSPDSNCLGADDTAGVFLCREMILRNVPGHYVFHYGEERGGIGSSQLARAYPDFLQQFTCAIAFDRQGTQDVITHQGTRTASDTFALSLAAVLNARSLNYRPDDSGIYTDTREYAGLIPECTNLSIGYQHCHSPAETLDCWHVLRLLDALTTVTDAALTIEREPGDEDDLWDMAEDSLYDLWAAEDARDDVLAAVQGARAKSPYLDPDYDAIIDALWAERQAKTRG